MTPQAVRDIQRSFDDAGVFGWLHAVDLADASHEIDVLADERVVLASVSKLPILMAFARAVDAGTMSARDRVRLDPQARTAGPTGIAAMADDVEMSWRDVARSMIAVSDNAAADILLDALGSDALASSMAGLGLGSTRIATGMGELFASIVDASPTSTTVTEAIDRLRDSGTLMELGSLDPDDPASNVTTARDMTRLLTSIWHDHAASPAQCAFMREVMGQQVWTQRLAAAFPFDDVVVSGKTGTFITLRHEVGVVEYPNGEMYAVAVFTRSARARLVLPAADAAIAHAAKIAVAALRANSSA